MKFRKGDKVRILESDELIDAGYMSLIGETGIITSVDEGSEEYVVEVGEHELTLWECEVEAYVRPCSKLIKLKHKLLGGE